MTGDEQFDAIVSDAFDDPASMEVTALLEQVKVLQQTVIFAMSKVAGELDEQMKGDEGGEPMSFVMDVMKHSGRMFVLCNHIHAAAAQFPGYDVIMPIGKAMALAAYEDGKEEAEQIYMRLFDELPGFKEACARLEPGEGPPVKDGDRWVAPHEKKEAS